MNTKRANELVQGDVFKSSERYFGTYTYVAMGRPKKALRNELSLDVCILDSTKDKESIGKETTVFFQKRYNKFKEVKVSQYKTR